MKKILLFIIAAGLSGILSACHSNPKNTYGGPSNAKDTAAKKRDTSSASH